MPWSLEVGNALDVLPEMEEGSVHCCVTGPPYFGQRDYGVEGQIGLEDTPREYVNNLIRVFDRVWRVLRDDGTLWVVIGDAYNNRCHARESSHQTGFGHDSDSLRESWAEKRARGAARMSIKDGDLKEKDLIGVPWMLATSLRRCGWYVRSEIIWAKGISGPMDGKGYRGGACMPEPVRDRCARAHETIFMFSKAPHYYYDYEAVKEPAVQLTKKRPRRDVWHVTKDRFLGEHSATFPARLIEPMVIAGCPPGGTVLDPFTGSGSTGLVALAHGRSFTGIELNPRYADIAKGRLREAWEARVQEAV